MNIPLVFTLLRMLLAGFIIVWIFSAAFWTKIAALLVFLFASLTDWLDGYLARRWKQTSDLGALLDPIADKVLVLGVMFAFAFLGLIPLWMVTVIAVREVLVTITRLWIVRQGVVLAAAKEGKQKTALQMVCLLFAFGWLIMRSWTVEHQLQIAAESQLAFLVNLGMWGVLLLTLYSGILFFWRYRGYLRF